MNEDQFPNKNPEEKAENLEVKLKKESGFTCVVCGGPVPENPYTFGGNSHYCSRNCRDNDDMAM